MNSFIRKITRLSMVEQDVSPCSAVFFCQTVFSRIFCKKLTFTPPVGLIAGRPHSKTSVMVEMAATITRAKARISLPGTSIIFSCGCLMNSVVRKQNGRCISTPPPKTPKIWSTQSQLSILRLFFLSRCSNSIEKLQ